MRNKIYLSAVILSLTTTQSFAASPFNSDKFYLGFDFGLTMNNSEMKTEDDSSTLNSSFKRVGDALDDQMYNDLKIGYTINDNFRAYAFWRASSEDSVQARLMNSANVQFGTVDLKRQEDIVGLGVDYLHPISDRLYWVIGGSLGRYSSEAELETSVLFHGVDKTKITSKGMAVGVNTSIGYAFNENWSIESGVNYMYLQDNVTKFENAGSQLEYTNDKQFSAFAGVTYTF